MIKRIYILLIFLLPCLGFSQDFSNFWEGHFSYLNIKDVSQGNGKLYAAAENAVFIYDPITLELETLSTITGLSGETISQIHYSELYELLIIGYDNGLMEIVLDNDDDVLTVIDILEKPTIPPTQKRINHFNEYNGYVYISTDYGISEYDLARLEFGDTFFIGNAGSQIRVTQTTIFNEFIYASCLDLNGIKKAVVASPDLIDFNEWENVSPGNYLAIESFQDNLFTGRGDRGFFEVINDDLVELIRYDSPPLDVRSVEDYLIVTLSNMVFVYDINFNIITQIPISEDFSTEYTCATVVGDDIYIGTIDFGVLQLGLNNQTIFNEVHPEGPLLNNSFSIEAQQNNLWLTFGDYSLTYNPAPIRERGLSHLKDESWINIPFDSVLGAKNLNKTAINPFRTNQVYVSSFQDGLLEINNDSPTILYNEDNSGLESLVISNNPNFKSIRQCASNFDRNGILWTMTGRVDRPLKSYDPSTGQWQGFDFTSLIQDGLSGEWGYDEIQIDNNGTKWIGGYNYGLIGFNENNSGTQLKSIDSEEQNMPSSFVTALAIDKRNQIWVGTPNGLRVLYNTANFFSDQNVQVEPIIILEDGVPKELLFQQFVSDIEVDGSNNKWIATIGSGIFYLSADGQETIFHFTKDNSPLPTNNVIDASIDDTSGEVYIATSGGLVSYRSGSSETQENFENVFVYPNPVRPTFNIIEEKVKIKGLSENVNVKILDIEGNLVAEAESNTNNRYSGYNLEIDGGVAFWNGKNLYNNVVSSGVYLVMLYDLDTFETKVLKVMVVR
jgi:hypothetical protein